MKYVTKIVFGITAPDLEANLDKLLSQDFGPPWGQWQVIGFNVVSGECSGYYALLKRQV